MNKIFDKRGLLSQIRTRSIVFELVRVYVDFDILVECCRTVDGAFEKKKHEKRMRKSHVFYVFSARIDGSKKNYFNNFIQFLSWFKLLFLTFKT